MIAREWKCTLPLRRRDGFLEHLHATGVAETSALPGYRGHLILERELPGEAVEVTLITCWTSLDAVKAFAGEDIGVAVLYPGDEAYELVPEQLNDLRKQLFAMTAVGSPSASVASACLETIGAIRDEYGAPKDERRHPDIASDRPWPLQVGTTAGV